LSANRYILTVSLPICIIFISSSCLIAQARNFRIILNRSGDTEHPSLVPDFMGNCFSFYPLGIMLYTGFSYIAFKTLSYVPSIPSFLRAFIMKWC
jgi:hypothetical protein